MYQQKTISKKQQNIKSLIGYGAKAQKTFLNKPAGKNNKVLKTVNIDLDAMMSEQKPQALTAKNESGVKRLEFSERQRRGQMLQASNELAEDDNVAATEQLGASKMPIEYSNLTYRSDVENRGPSTGQNRHSSMQIAPGLDRPVATTDSRDLTKDAQEKVDAAPSCQDGINHAATLTIPSSAANQNQMKFRKAPCLQPSRNSKDAEAFNKMKADAPKAEGTASKGKAFGSKLSTPSQSININYSNVSNTPNINIKSSFNSAYACDGNLKGTYSKMNKHSSISEHYAKPEVYTTSKHQQAYEKSILYHKSAQQQKD